MLLTFRQGIARYQADVLNTPIFLQRSSGAGNFIDLQVSPDPTIIVFAHRGSNYIVEETKSVTNAWGPISGSATIYLYWNINLLTGVLTRGQTLFPPIYSSAAPITPAVDQHWFDTTDTTMYVWNGTKWSEKVRVFAAYLSSGSIIHPYPLGSQAGINGEFEGGSLILDIYNKPLRQSDGTFVTSVTSLLIVNGSANKVKFEAEIMAGMAIEPLPKFSLVRALPGGRIRLAKSNDPYSRISGIVLEDLWENEVGNIITNGFVRNDSWAFSASQVNRPVFCDVNGQLTTVPPTTGVIQIVGYVFDTDAIHLNIHQAIILDDLRSIVPPIIVPPPLNAPTADFYTVNTNGVAPFAVTFLNTSIGSPTSFEWDFTNDGVIDQTTATGTYTFATPGVYTVSLKATNAFGSTIRVQPNYINVAAPTAAGAFTNLGVALVAPSQVSKNSTLQIGISVSNDGFLTATNVVRVVTIADVNGSPVTVSTPPLGAVVSRDTNRTIITFSPVMTLGTGLSYGPVFFNIITPNRTGPLAINASVESPEIDSTVGDNTTSISVEIMP